MSSVQFGRGKRDRKGAREKGERSLDVLVGDLGYAHTIPQSFFCRLEKYTGYGFCSVKNDDIGAMSLN